MSHRILETFRCSPSEILEKNVTKQQDEQSHSATEMQRNVRALDNRLQGFRQNKLQSTCIVACAAQKCRYAPSESLRQNESSLLLSRNVAAEHSPRALFSEITAHDRPQTPLRTPWDQPVWPTCTRNTWVKVHLSCVPLREMPIHWRQQKRFDVGYM